MDSENAKVITKGGLGLGGAWSSLSCWFLRREWLKAMWSTGRGGGLRFRFGGGWDSC